MTRVPGSGGAHPAKNHFGWCLLASGFLLGLSDTAGAARLSMRDGVVYLEGDLVPGDSDRMVALARPEARDRDEFILDVDSAGGNLNAGMDLAIVVSLNRIPVRVRFGSVCYASCFSVFAAAPKRLVSTPARIGVNRPQRNGADADAAAISRLMALYARLGVRQSILDKLRDTPGNRIGMLNEDEIRSLGPFEETRFDQEDVALKLVLGQLPRDPGNPLPTTEELAAMERTLLEMMPPLESQAFWDWFDQRTQNTLSEASPAR